MEEQLYDLAEILRTLVGPRNDWSDIYDEHRLAGEFQVKQGRERQAGKGEDRYEVYLDKRHVFASVRVRHSASEDIARIRFSHTDSIPEVERPDMLFRGSCSAAIREAQRLLGNYADDVKEGLPGEDMTPDDEVIEDYHEWQRRVITMPW